MQNNNYDKDCIFCKIINGEIPSKFIKEMEQNAKEEAY